MPSLYIIAGPNGAGKTTFIKRFAPRELALLDFINADEIAMPHPDDTIQSGGQDYQD